MSNRRLRCPPSDRPGQCFAQGTSSQVLQSAFPPPTLRPDPLSARCRDSPLFLENATTADANDIHSLPHTGRGRLYVAVPRHASRSNLALAPKKKLKATKEAASARADTCLQTECMPHMPPSALSLLLLASSKNSAGSREANVCGRALRWRCSGTIECTQVSFFPASHILLLCFSGSTAVLSTCE
jgi:hypothetical protein